MSTTKFQTIGRRLLQTAVAVHHCYTFTSTRDYQLYYVYDARIVVVCVELSFCNDNSDIRIIPIDGYRMLFFFFFLAKHGQNGRRFSRRLAAHGSSHTHTHTCTAAAAVVKTWAAEPTTIARAVEVHVKRRLRNGLAVSPFR